MTSLCPGTLFHSSGLNHYSTPTPSTDTPADIERKLKRVPFNGRDWPRESPVARVYDIGNTSTKMVLLNRKLKRKSQLRGLTDINGEIAAPEPDRHTPEEPTCNYHRNCTSSSSEPYRPRIQLDLGWVNSQQRPPVTFDSGSHVNHRRHTSCRVPGDSPVVGWNLPRRPHTSASMATEAELGSMLNDPDLSNGERRYLYSIARIYSTSQMKQLKKDQYSQLLVRELAKGYYSPYEYERYFNYLNSPRKTQFGKLDTYREERRTQSAPPPAHPLHDTSGRGTPCGETDRTESRKGHRMTTSSRSLAALSYGSSRTSLASRNAQRKKKPKSKTAAKDAQSPPSSGKKSSVREEYPESPKEKKPVKQEEPEAVAAVAAANRDAVSEHDDKTDGNKEEQVDSPRDTARSHQSLQKEITPPPEDESPRKGELTDRTGPEEEEVERSEDKDERSSESVCNNTNTNTSSSNNNSLLKLIVSDAEKDDDTEKASEEVDARSTAEEETPTPQEGGMVKRFSSSELADGYTPRVNKEGRTRPLSRVGRTDAVRERENSDDDYGDTDEETETSKLQPIAENKDTSEDAQQEERSPIDEKPDTSRTEESQDQPEERGGLEKEQGTAVDVEKRAGSPEESDERAEDNHENNGQHSLIIPVTPRHENGDEASATNNHRKTSNGEVLDLSAESRNRDVDKIEY